MRVVAYHEHGGPEVLRLEEWPLPRPGPGQARVRVRSCGVNRVDLQTRAGMGRKVELPHVPGCEIAGEVDALGPGEAPGIEVGQRVLVHFAVTCGHCEFCLKGEETRCTTRGIVGVTTQGGHAEYAVVPLRCLIPLPEALSFEDAAAMGLAATTAWHMLMVRAQVRAGETVLVLAAGSGVGVAAIQIARLAGARVIAAASTEAKLAKARALGAEATINYAERDFQQEVLRLTSGRGVEVVVESVGADTWDKSLRSACLGGRITWVGTTSGHEVALDLRPVYSRELSLLGSTSATRAEARMVLRLTAEGRLRPVVDRVLPLQGVAEAHQALARREQFGKILVNP